MYRDFVRPAVFASVLLAAACGSSGGHHVAVATHHANAPVAAPTPQGITCLGIVTDLKKALKDLRKSNRHYQEAWVSGGYRGALKTLINDTTGANVNGNTVNTDAAAFNSDASAYLAENSPYLAPGWEGPYSTVNRDMKALASACGL